MATTRTTTTTTTTFFPTYLFVCPGSSLAPLLAAEVADSFQVKPVPPVPRMEVAILKGLTLAPRNGRPIYLCRVPMFWDKWSQYWGQYLRELCMFIWWNRQFFRVWGWSCWFINRQVGTRCLVGLGHIKETKVWITWLGKEWWIVAILYLYLYIHSLEGA